MRWLILAAVAAAGCGGTAPPDPTAGRLKVVATFSVLGEFARAVGGDRVEVVTLVGPDGDAHVFDPSPQDAARLAAAAVVVENGAGFEGWLDRLYAATGARGTRVVATDGLDLLTAHGEPDPHVWHDVRNAMHMVDRVRDGLCAADPANADGYRAAASAYLARLADLERWAEATLAAVPPGDRKLVTCHDTFGYFARRYGFTVAGTVLPSFSTEAADPSAAAFARLVEAVRREKVRAVFCEASHNPKLVERLATEAGVRVASPLYTDALGPPGCPGGTYEGMVRHNVTTIADALKP